MLNISTFCPLTSPVSPFNRPALLILTFKPPFLTRSQIIMSSLTGILVNVYFLYIRVKFLPWSLLQVCQLSLLIRIYNLTCSCPQKPPNSERVLVQGTFQRLKRTGLLPVVSSDQTLIVGHISGSGHLVLFPFFPHTEWLASPISLPNSKLPFSLRQWI